MLIYTARYSNKNLVGQPGWAKVQTSNGAPKFPLKYPLIECKALAPDYSTMKLPKDKFRVAYRKKLDRLGIARVQDMLMAAAREHKYEGKPAEVVVLLCFEDVRRPDDWCHRTMLAEWLNEQGVKVEELEEAEPPKSEKADPTKPRPGQKAIIYPSGRGGKPKMLATDKLGHTVEMEALF